MSTSSPAFDEAVRVALYRGFAASGRCPSADELVEAAGDDEAAVHAALERLAEARHVALDADGAVVMAHPFTSRNLGFSVMGESTLWWGGCAWDSFALPHLLPQEPEVLVATRCPGCDTPHALVVRRDAPPEGELVAHFLVPMAHCWDDVVHTCRHQRLFCGERCVERWLADTGNERGYVMDLATLWRLAEHWYEGRLHSGYQRREPSAAAAYFAQVGLEGPFWGL
jgi:Alkylmercury lyase